MRSRLPALMLVLASRAVLAQPVEPGPQASPPGPAPPGLPALQTDDDGRQAIRGKPVPASDEEDPRKATVRRFEEEVFPKGERDVVVGEDGEEARGVGKDALPPELVSPQKAHPAPAPPAKPDIPWLKGVKVGDLPVRWDPRVIRFLEYYKNDPRGHATMAYWLRAQGRYRRMIVDALHEAQLPEDLLYVAMIESSYDPHDYSRAGASGLWQFMPEAGRIYGLKRDYWVDERNDPEKSNTAQMLYFRDLYDRFGSWHISLAAFNCGYGAVLKSMAKYNTNDFWALLDIESGLPWESSVYVPKALAAAIIGRNREAFGFADVVPDPAFDYDRVTVDKSVSLQTIARAAGSDAKTIAELNPELRRGRTPPGVKDYAVRIPRGTAVAFAQSFPQLRGDWDGYDAYVMRWGERFEDVARVHGISPRQLRELNGVKDMTELSGGTVIVVPHADETLQAQLRKDADKDLYHSDVAPGGPEDPMIVAVPDKDASLAGKKRVFYRVVAGDTVEEIAGAFGVKPAEVAAWNKLDLGTKITARMVFQLFVPPSFDADKAGVALLDPARLMIVTAGSPEHLDLVEGRKGRARVTLVAKKGDSLDSIGRRYGLSKYDVARINRRSYDTPLEPGEQIIVYAVVDRAKARKAGVFNRPHREKASAGHPTKKPRKK